MNFIIAHFAPVCNSAFRSVLYFFSTQERGDKMKFQRIQDLRTDADMSQKQISEILHISQRSYSHYETGSRNIPIEMLIRLANYYDTSIDYLVGRTNNKKMVK
jgi:DNA-binding XRE family transcriptional regulator